MITLWRWALPIGGAIIGIQFLDPQVDTWRVIAGVALISTTASIGTKIGESNDNTGTSGEL